MLSRFKQSLNHTPKRPHWFRVCFIAQDITVDLVHIISHYVAGKNDQCSHLHPSLIPRPLPGILLFSMQFLITSVLMQALQYWCKPSITGKLGNKARCCLGNRLYNEYSQMSIKRPTSGGQTCNQEAAVWRTFHIERSSFWLHKYTDIVSCKYTKVVYLPLHCISPPLQS